VEIFQRLSELAPAPTRFYVRKIFEKIGRATRNFTYSNFLSFLNGNSLYAFFDLYLKTVSKETFFRFQLNYWVHYEGRKLHTPREKKHIYQTLFYTK